MRFRHLVQTCAALAFAMTLSTPALAGGHKHHPGAGPDGRDDRPEWQGDRPYYDHDRAREDWLADCRQRISDNGVGGAVIGGVAGGVLGNRIAGRGNRTVGTVAGAAVGAIAGAAIDKAEDRGRDECETYLDDYYARYSGGGYGAPAYGHGYHDQPSYHGYPAYGYGYAMPMMPVMIQPQKPCVETVTTTEYVTRPARRAIPRASRPDKRIRIVPDKRIPLK